MIDSAQHAADGPVNCARRPIILSRNVRAIVRRSYSLGRRKAGGDAPNARIWSNWVLDVAISCMFSCFLLCGNIYANYRSLPAADAATNSATSAARRGRLVPASSGTNSDFSRLDTCGRRKSVTTLSGDVYRLPVSATSAQSGCRGLSSCVRIVTLGLVRRAGTIGGRILHLC